MSDSSSSSQDERSVVIHTEVKKVARRGPTTMHELTCIRNLGKRKTIEYNDQGQPIGENAKKMQSFIGVCVRQKIPVTYNHWKEVPQELKDKIFNCVESFVLDWRSKHHILQSASKKFRTFKSTLTRTYILPFKDEPICLQNPPEKYPHIDQEQWNSFVNARLSEEWETLSRAHKEIRAKCLYNHHISRKGYANLAQELDLSSDPSNRAILWKEARKGKNNEYFDDATRECAARIDELAAIHKGEDILTEALGTSEHSGRVRGVGEFVSPSLYFNVVKGKSKTQELQPNKSTTEGSNPSKKKSKGKEIVNVHEEIYVTDEQKMEGKPCHLAVESVDNIVAVGTIFDNNVQCPTVHGVPLGVDNVRVMVDIVIDEYATIPIPVRGEIETLNQTIGGFVAWPRRLVILSEEKNISSSRTSQTRTQLSKHTDVHVSIKLLNRYVMLSMQHEDTVEINLSKDIFGKEKNIYLTRNDIMQYCTMIEIGYSCILTYIAYLWDVYEYEITKKFLIVDPATISPYVKSQEYRFRNLANRLEMVNLEQLVLIPYKSGCHWMLIIINLRENCVYVLDSLRRKIQEDYQRVINTSLKIWQAKHSIQRYRTNTIWKSIKCPCQMGSVECGYYVQKYIREIVQNASTHISNIFNTKNAYQQEEIDEVRIEWADFVGGLV
ncbi:uncharacterized protein LOC111007859 isoform X2 [Momordica charantia]|uniref:Uncharacterized protein LOC111007859 isoform X2 n=1 Tax=Momordica charantia TaxID=3673 RepID=A0A6J1C4J7_MOMCH|nr:uncharacterized protein LOC111007859 isoform X2 [Momordica charantia]